VLQAKSVELGTGEGIGGPGLVGGGGRDMRWIRNI